MRSVTGLLAGLILATVQAASIETTITYQGQLSQAGEPASGNFDLEMRLFDVADGGLEIVPVINLQDVSVADGLFTVELDFGPTPYAGDQLWLQVSVREGGSSGGFTQLLPRQKVTPAPYALHAEMVAVGAVAGAEIADGTIGVADINISQVQQRIGADCPSGSAIRQIDAIGAVVCETDDDTTYTAGDGLALASNAFSVDFTGDGVASTAARSDHLHEDRYGAGDLAVRVVAGGSPAENGAALLAAVAGITDASAARPYTILLSGGVFDLPAAGVVLKPFVSLKGVSTESTVLTAPGSDSFGAAQATVTLSDGVRVERLTVINTAGDTNSAIAILATGEGFRLSDLNIRVEPTTSFLVSGLTSINSSNAISGRLSRVNIEVDDGNGLGANDPTGDIVELVIEDSVIRVNGAGTGISDPGLDSSGTMQVKNSLVEVLGGGTGFAVSASNLSDNLTLDGVEVRVSGGVGANRGLFRAGSGFRVLVRSSVIDVSGASGSAAVRFNNGRVTIQNSRIRAPIGLLASSNGSFAGGFFLDSSVLDVGTAIQIEGSSTGTHQVRVGASKIDASNIVNVVSGLANLVCVNAYDENYQALGSDCL